MGNSENGEGHVSKPGDKSADKKWTKASFKPWIFTILILLVTIAVIGYISTREAPEPKAPEKKLIHVEVITLVTKEYVESLTLPAIIHADRVASIGPEFSSTLKRWFVPEGSQVEMGDVIAEIDTKTLRLNLEELEAALRTASKNVSLSNVRMESTLINLTNIRKNVKIQEIALESAQSDFVLAQKKHDRSQKLASQKLVSGTNLEDAENVLTQAELSVLKAKQNVSSANIDIRAAEVAIKVAMADIDLAEARIYELEASINLLENQIEKGKLKAPFSGRIEKHLAEAGEIVLANIPIVLIYDLKFLRATVNIPDRYISFLDSFNKGAQIYIHMNMPGAEQRIKAKLIVPGLPKLTGGVEAGLELNAEIAHVAQSSDPESNTFKVELRLPNPGEALKHGTIVRSRIEYLYYPDAIIIPMKAVQVTDVGPRVLVIESNGDMRKAVNRDIAPVSIQGNNLFVRGGLKKGDQLIVAGWKGLVGGEEVNILVQDGQFIKLDSKD